MRFYLYQIYVQYRSETTIISSFQTLNPKSNSPTNGFQFSNCNPIQKYNVINQGRIQLCQPQLAIKLNASQISYLGLATKSQSPLPGYTSLLKILYQSLVHQRSYHHSNSGQGPLVVLHFEEPVENPGKKKMMVNSHLDQRT